MVKSRILPDELVEKLDRLPQEEAVLQQVLKKFDSVAGFYGFDRAVTSLFENPRIFAPLAKAGFFNERPPVFCKTRFGNEYMLRLAGALSLLRFYGTHKMNSLPHPLKLRFGGEVFSLDSARGKKILGRSEWGMLMIGEEGPIAEAEIAQVIWRTIKELGIADDKLEFRVNAVGCGVCRPAFRSQMNPYLRGRAVRLCKECKRNLKRTPTKIFVCGEEKCRVVSNHAPQMLDFLCDGCKKHLRGFLEFLDEGNIPYSLDPRFFKDGSWFSGFIFEFIFGPRISEGEVSTSGQKLLLAEGGRLSRAGELLSGKKLDAVAGTVFVDAFLKMSGGNGVFGGQPAKQRVFLVQLGDLAKRKSLNLFEILRQEDIGVRESLGRDSVKSQLKLAELNGAEIALILGQKEALDNTVIVREVQSGIQETVSQKELVEFLKKKLK